MAGRLLLLLGFAAALSGVAARWAYAREAARLDAAVARGPAPDAAARAAAYARSMWALYDPLKGRHGDPLKRFGFVVCIDVPLRAYASAGVSLPELLRRAAREHPGWFHIGPDNPPHGPFFVRRVRNYSDLFSNHPDLEVSASPRPGDLAFYGRWHIGLVTRVSPDGSYRVAEARGPILPVAERGDAAMTRSCGKPSFFGRLRRPAK